MSSEYDRRAQAWVTRRFGAIPDLGSVTFSNDCAAYASGGWANVEVDWTVDGQPRGECLEEEAWRFDWTQVIRELIEIPLDEDVSPGPGQVPRPG